VFTVIANVAPAPMKVLQRFSSLSKSFTLHLASRTFVELAGKSPFPPKTSPTASPMPLSLEVLKAALILQRRISHVLNASTESDFDPAFAKLGELQAGALIIGHDVFFNAQTRPTCGIDGPQ
jgi:hypothetical protein